jgi:hypothetical protein
MKTVAVRIIVIGLLMLAGVTPGCRAASADSSLRPTSEVISVLKSNYVDRDKLNEKLLNEATVAGLIEALGRGATIVEPEAPSTNGTEAVAAEPKLIVPLARAEVIDPNIAYIRLADVTAATPAALDLELKKFADAKVMGYVLDLRFADGTNFTAAADIASRFLGDGQTLFTLKSSEKGVQIFRATSETKADTDLTSAPLMLLVNAETRGSAEALAGALRAQDRGIVIGSQTAGSAAGWEDVKLSDGRTLRLATAKIVLPQTNSSLPGIDLFPGGITPDVAVKIDAKTEHDVVFEVQTNETLTASLQPRVKKKDLTEAQLVKAFHGQAIDAEGPSTDREHEEEDEIQNVRDVVLQRGVDILKGIRVVLTWQ